MRQRTHRSLLACAALLSALSLTAAAGAQTSPAPKETSTEGTAAEHAKRAEVAYNIQDWATAAKEYEAAYKVDQNPTYLWGLAQTQRLAGKHAEALQSYKAFKRSDVSVNQANAAEMMIAKCEAEIAKQEARAAQASKSEEKPSSAPAAAPKEPQQDAAKSSGGLGIGWFITGAVITVGLGAAATWSGLDTKAKAADYKDEPTRDRYNEGRDLELRTNLLFAATGLAAAGTTVIAIFTDWSGSPEKQSAKRGFGVRPAVAPRGGALFLTGDF